ELRFDLNVDLIKNALGITAKDSAHPFVAPPDGDLVIDFVNNLGYTEELEFVLKMGKVMKVRKRKSSDHLVDEEDEEDQPASEPPVEDDEYNLQRGIKMSLESFQAPVDEVAIHKPDSGIIQKLLEVKGKGKGITPVTKVASTRPSTQPQYDTSTNVVHDTLSPVDVETGADLEKCNSEAHTEILNDVEEHGEDVSNTMALEERTVELDEGHAGSEPGKTLES
nr:hypothetical protein [Tanacetum cinerariifolium]